MFVIMRTLIIRSRTRRLKKLSRRHNFQPVSVGIFDEVNAHRFVFKADAAHLAVFCVCGFKVIRAESQMKLAFAKIIFLRMFAQPRQFQFKVFGGVRHIDDDERTVRSVFAAHFMKAKRLAIKGDVSRLLTL